MGKAFRHMLFGVIPGCALCLMVAPTAGAAPDPCSASGVAATASGVLNSASGYLDGHPDANNVLTVCGQPIACRGEVVGPRILPQPPRPGAGVEGHRPAAARPAWPVQHVGVAGPVGRTVRRAQHELTDGQLGLTRRLCSSCVRRPRFHRQKLHTRRACGQARRLRQAPTVGRGSACPVARRSAHRSRRSPRRRRWWRHSHRRSGRAGGHRRAGRR